MSNIKYACFLFSNSIIKMYLPNKSFRFSLRLVCQLFNFQSINFIYIPPGCTTPFLYIDVWLFSWTDSSIKFSTRLPPSNIEKYHVSTGKSGTIRQIRYRDMVVWGSWSWASQQCSDKSADIASQVSLCLGWKLSQLIQNRIQIFDATGGSN